MTSNSINYLRLREDTRTHKVNEKISRGTLKNAIRMTRESIRHNKKTEKQATKELKESRRHNKRTERQTDYSNKSGRISALAAQKSAAVAAQNADTNYLNYLLGIQNTQLKGREVAAKELLTGSQIGVNTAKTNLTNQQAVTEAYKPTEILAKIDKLKADKGKTKTEKGLIAAKWVYQTAQNMFAGTNALTEMQTKALNQLKASYEAGNAEKAGKILDNDNNFYWLNMILGNSGGIAKLMSLFK